MILPETGTPLQIFFNLLLWGCITLFLYKNRFKEKLPKNKCIWFGLLIFCLYSYWCRDYFGYMQLFYDPHPLYEHLEPFYVFLREHLSSYLLFRIIVWGTSLLNLYLIIKRLKLPESYILFSICIIFLLWFSYGRVTLAITTAVLGMTYFTHPMRFEKISFLVGTGLICASYYFHRSAILLVVLISVVKFVPLNKYTAIIMVASIPVMVYMLNNYFMSFMITEADMSEMDIHILRHYSGISGRNILGIGPRIMSFLQRYSVYAMAVYLLYTQFVKRQKLGSGDYMYFKLAILFIIISLAFDYSDSLDKLKTRIRIMSVFPLVLSFAAHVNKYGESKLTRKVICFIVFNPLYTLTYMMYCAQIDQ